LGKVAESPRLNAKYQAFERIILALDAAVDPSLAGIPKKQGCGAAAAAKSHSCVIILYIKQNSMKKILLPFFALTLLMACEKEQADHQDAVLEARKKNLKICHVNEEGDYSVMTVNENAWPAHQAHGDVRLDDQDGDGYVPDNGCGYGQQGDCDDNNSAVNPAAAEICDNLIDDDCDGDVDEADSDCATSCVEGELEVTVDNGSEMYSLYVYPSDNGIIQWGSYGLVGASSFWDGAGNTQKILTTLGDGNYAAKKCADLAVETGCDWYLPSINELYEIWKQLGPTDNGYNGSGDITTGRYWSSTEREPTPEIAAWALAFAVGYQEANGKLNDDMRVRCVRR
jgi:hypothetical protein